MRTGHLTLGTAGHIDHGKSSIVRALTGIDPDRLKEEKARGITIELGFAEMDLGEDRALSFVDVPGHERFVRHMVAGATGIDAVMLVIAADDGVRPQTREHLDICRLLDLRHGFVVVTKSDLVDPELCEVVELEVREFLEGSFLSDAPIVAASAKTGEGLDAVRESLVALFDEVPERSVSGITRLPVDRSFIMRGFGTVVTGTLVSGRLAEGDEVAVLPGAGRGRVRGLQVHRHKVGEARAGQRTAVNVQGIDRAEIPRGSTVTQPGALETTRRMLGRVRLLEDAPKELRKGGRLRFHQGTCERDARMRILGTTEDGELDVELRFHEETLLLPGDRFILRRPAPVDTIGGGIVVDARPPRGKSGALASFETAGADPVEAVLVRVARSGLEGRVISALASELGMSDAELETEIRSLAADGRVVEAAGLWFERDAWNDLTEGVESILTRFHEHEPLLGGMSREELRSRLCREMPQEAWRAWLRRGVENGRLRLEGDRVALAGHRVVLSNEDQALAERIDLRFREAGLDPPDVTDVLSEGGAGPKGDRVAELLVSRGTLVRIQDGRLFHGEALESLRARLREHAKTSKTIDVGTFKQLAGVTRKNAIPLLEHLDAERTTRRVGNVREILKA